MKTDTGKDKGMVGFRAGGENLLETFKLMEYAHSFEGLVSID